MKENHSIFGDFCQIHKNILIGLTPPREEPEKNENGPFAEIPGKNLEINRGS
jgi:hypothetical protein